VVVVVDVVVDVDVDVDDPGRVPASLCDGGAILDEGEGETVTVEGGGPLSRLGAGGTGVAVVTCRPTGMIPLVRAAAAAEGVVLRGGASPMASCIAEVRSRVTSVPHWTSAR
jgi:hypothetical protein